MRTTAMMLVLSLFIFVGIGMNTASADTPPPPETSPSFQTTYSPTCAPGPTMCADCANDTKCNEGCPPQTLTTKIYVCRTPGHHKVDVYNEYMFTGCDHGEYQAEVSLTYSDPYNDPYVNATAFQLQNTQLGQNMFTCDEEMTALVYLALGGIPSRQLDLGVVISHTGCECNPNGVTKSYSIGSTCVIYYDYVE